jgi:2',3'-cyclic-nucleotide 2'-phosphodiesterase (5'-nucleotidase family)
MKKVLSLLLALTAGLMSMAQSQNIVIVALNDVHAHIDNFPKLAAYLTELRANNPNVVVMNAGDNISGNPYVDYAEDKGEPMYRLLNTLGIDVSNFGNHDFDNDQENLARRVKQANFPMICANMDPRKTQALRFDGVKTIKTKGGVELAVVGLIGMGGNGLPQSHPKHFRDIVFTDPVKTACEYAKLKKPGTVLIALSHCGVNDDKKIAKACKDYDLIVGSHSHTKLPEGNLTNGVLISQAGAEMDAISLINLKIENGVVVEKSAKMVSMSDYPKEDPKVAALVKQIYDNPAMQKVIARNATDIKGKQALGSLIAYAITRELKVDMGVHNEGGTRISALPAGDITLSDIYKLDPMNYDIIRFEMTYAQMKTIFMNAFNRGKKPILFSNFPYTIIKDPETGKAKDAIIYLEDGTTELSADKTYSVAMHSYIVGTYPFDRPEKNIETGIRSGDNLINYLKKIGTLDWKAPKIKVE